MNTSMTDSFSPNKAAGEQASLLTRRQMLRGSGLLCAAAFTSSPLFAAAASTTYDQRPAPAKRKFVSRAIEAAIVRTKKQIADPQLAAIFENCFPNTL